MLKKLVLEKFTELKHDKITREELQSSSYFKNVAEMYKLLGGQFIDLPTNYGPWDISTTNFIIELDEERHYNRYRLLTLHNDFYLKNIFFSTEDYKKYCFDFESKCPSYGQNWKNNSTEKMFIQSDIPGILDRNGSSRWRQRAYYDFLKDVTSKIKGIPVIRISIHDTFGNKTINELLTNKDVHALNQFIDFKTKPHRC